MALLEDVLVSWQLKLSTVQPYLSGCCSCHVSISTDRSVAGLMVGPSKAAVNQQLCWLYDHVNS